MNEPKAEKISISLPNDIRAALDAHVATIPGETRSGWLTEVTTRELKSCGALGAVADARAKLLGFAEEFGFERAAQILQHARRNEIRQPRKRKAA